MKSIKKSPSQGRKGKKLQDSFSNNILLIAGVDEVGRGPWAGPLVACAYVCVKKVTGIKITDSKKMNQAERETAYSKLIKAGYYGLGQAEPSEIDRLGLSRANRLAFKRALSALKVKPDLIMVDGRDNISLASTGKIPFRTLTKGDSIIHEISCASIIAKVTRDRHMEKMAKKYPQYGFEKHKGYGTRLHKNCLKKHGVCRIHRKSYKPVQEAMIKDI